MTKKLLERLDLSGKRRVFAVGDIHGAFDLLEQKLAAIEFDRTKDFLISVGDLVDRGPQSPRAINYIQQPWFKHIIGNHEEFCSDSYHGDSYWHRQNGGEWFQELDEVEREHHFNLLLNAPYLLEVITPGRQKIGFVHADLHTDDWNEAIEYPHFETFSWSRNRISHVPGWEEKCFQVKGIDWLIMGHTVVMIPFRKGNCVWIDTGACFYDNLTIIDVDKDIEGISTTDFRPYRSKVRS